MKKLNADNLKNALWDTLKDLKDEKVTPERGNAIATQAREILRTVKVQLQISTHNRQDLPKSLTDFADKVGQ